MNEPNKTRICRNGHQQTVSNSKFCIFCGTSLVDSNHAPNKSSSPNRPPNQPNAVPPNFNPPVQSGQNQNFQPPTPPNYQQGNDQAQYIQQQPQNYLQQPQYVQASDCYTCGGSGQGLNEKTII